MATGPVVNRVVPAMFEFELSGPAISAQSRNRDLLRDWKARVSAAALARWPTDRPLFTQALDAEISEFSRFPRRDRDNLAKPILDAMQGVVFANDRQLRRILVEWCDIEGPYRIRHMSPVVAAAFVRGDEFVWIRLFPHQPRGMLKP